MAAAAAPVNVLEFEALARVCMEPSTLDDFAGAAGRARTLSENRRALDSMPSVRLSLRR